MADVLTAEQRRLNMSRIRGQDTKPELKLRSALHAKGIRYRLHRRDLPGCPDLVFPGPRVVVFVDGCFWHGCPEHAVRPQNNRAFWDEKLGKNRRRDAEVNTKLAEAGWRVLRFWEHAVRRDVGQVVADIEQAIRPARPAEGSWPDPEDLPREPAPARPDRSAVKDTDISMA